MILLGYTRDKKGVVVNYHPISVANTVHTWTGGGWTTDQFVLVKVKDNKSEHKQRLVERIKGLKPNEKLRIRKLTNREVFRLMGLEDSEIDKIMSHQYMKKGKMIPISKTRQYAMAGNSIVVPHLAFILENIFFPKKTKKAYQLNLFDDMPNEEL